MDIKKHHFFEGSLNKKSYFEQWYINIVDETKQNVVSIKFGVLLEEKEKRGFVQISSTIEKESASFVYPIEKVSYDETSLTIGESVFSEQAMLLQLEKGSFSINGEINFIPTKQLDKTTWRPGLMGPFKMIPFLASYHEILSLESSLSGNIVLNGKAIDFIAGKGYMEKEWGKHYPKVWLWSQCNHFKHQDAALMLGVARMPILFNYYTAFAIPIFFNDKLEIYSNYTGAHIAKLYRYKGYIHLVIVQKGKVVEIKIFGEDDIPLTMGIMDALVRDVYESITAKIELKITQGGRVIFEDIGECAGLKIGGNTSKLK